MTAYVVNGILIIPAASSGNVPLKQLNEILVPEQLLTEKCTQASLPPQDEYTAELCANKVYGTAFRFYLLFSDRQLLEASNLADLEADTIFYNRYYWFARFATLRNEVDGSDAGTAQQQYQLLAEEDSENVDLTIIERLEELARRQEMV